MRQLLIIFGILFTHSLQAQEMSYPYVLQVGYNYPMTHMDNDELIIIQDFDDDHFVLLVDHISLESLEILSTDTINLYDLLGEDILDVKVNSLFVKEDHYELFGMAETTTFGDVRKIIRIKLNTEFEVTQFDITDTDYAPQFIGVGFDYFIVFQFTDGTYYLHFPGPFNLLVNENWDSTSSVDLPFFNYADVTGLGKTLNGFDDRACICNMDSCIEVNSSLDIINTFEFNAFELFGEIHHYTFFSNSSLNISDSTFLIQAVAEPIENFPEDPFLENMIWKISKSGTVLDSNYIHKFGSDEIHSRNTMHQDGDRIYGASVMRTNDTEVFGPAGDSLYFFAINENLDSLWSASYGSEDFYYNLIGIEVKNHCLIAYGTEIPIEGEPWELGGQFFLLKYTWEELGLTMDELSAGSKEMNIYPNPASNLISIETNDESGPIEGISAYDLMGNLVYSKDLENTEKLHQEIDISLWAKGMYVLKVFAKETSFNSKFIKE